MTKEGIPSDRELYNPVLQALHHFKGDATYGNIVIWVANRLKLSHEQLSVLRNSYNSQNDTLFKHNVRFALTHMRMAGYFDNPRRSVWQLTAVGKVTRRVDPKEVLRLRDTNPKEKQGISWRKRRQKPSPVVRTIHKATATDLPVRKPASTPTPDSSYSIPIHDEIQWLLLSFGNKMKLDLWVASNDRGKSFQGNRFSDIPGLRSYLPDQFDQLTMRTIEPISVLWLKGQSIVAGFEIEHTTSNYSGILRMSDLVALQPNINIALYIVAPDACRDKVKSEINRPTFRSVGLPQHCCYIDYSKLTSTIEAAKLGGFLPHLNHTILDELAERLTD